jgi:hypothetical protein
MYGFAESDNQNLQQQDPSNSWKYLSGGRDQSELYLQFKVGMCEQDLPGRIPGI